jgi:hypothetical protein
MIIRPPALEPNSQLQNRLCRWGLRASVARQVQSGRYSVLGLKILASECLVCGGRCGFQKCKVWRPASEGGPYLRRIGSQG